MKSTNEAHSLTVALNWRTLIPHFSQETNPQYFSRLKHEALLWRANPNYYSDADGELWSYYPLTWLDWCNSFGCWLDGNAEPGLFDRSLVYPESEHPLAYSYWMDFIAEPERAIHWKRCKTAFEEAGLYDD